MRPSAGRCRKPRRPRWASLGHFEPCCLCTTSPTTSLFLAGEDPVLGQTALATTTTMKNITVISGGTATNHVLDAFDPGPQRRFTVTYVLPVSDNGGSSSEILRVLGGCAIGDIRSRLVRLIPDETAVAGVRGVKQLLAHRLPPAAGAAKHEWSLLVDGTHSLWRQVDASVRVLLQSFLIHVDMEIHKRARLAFRFELASVGNLFLTGARLFFGDLDSAIELICRVCRIDEHVGVCGCLNTNFTYHIAAVLENGELIRGQSQISHPSAEAGGGRPCAVRGKLSSSSVEDLVGSSVRSRVAGRGALKGDDDGDNDDDEGDDEGDDDGGDGDPIHPSLEPSQLHFEKDTRNVPPLASPIHRLLYISPYGEEIHPRASLRTLAALGRSDVIVYSIGSLWTSVVPVLLLRGVGDQIVRRRHARKVLLLNHTHDRETAGLDGLDFVHVVRRAIEYSATQTPVSVADVVTDVVCTSQAATRPPPAAVDYLSSVGVACHVLPGDRLTASAVASVLHRVLENSPV